MKKVYKLLVFLIIALLFVFNCSYVFANTHNAQLRTKSQVLLIINNIAHSKHDKALNQLMNEKLQEKIDVIYRQEDSTPYIKNLVGQENAKLTVEEIINKIAGSKSNYLIYAELKHIDKDTNFNLIYHGKEVEVTFYLRIVDIKNKKDLYASEYSLKAEDDTDYFFVGSGSVAKKALEKVLFRAGEAISVYLPL